MIDVVFEFLLSKTIGISIIIILLLMLRPITQRFLNAFVGYALWLMIPVFLVFPNFLINGESAAAKMTIFLSESVLSSTVITEQFFKNDLLKVSLMGIWLLGFILSLGFFITRYKKLKSSISDFSGIDEMPIQIRKKIYKFNIRVVKSDLVDVPAVFGILQAYLILPHKFFQLPVSSQKMILHHEMHHLRRADHQFNILRMAIKSLFWFNPLTYIGDKFCEADQEISCDLGVLQNSKGSEKKQYACALIESVNLGTQSSLVSQWNFQSLVKERVKMLKNTNVRSWHKWIGIIFSISAIGLTNSIVMAGNEVGIKEPAPSSTIMPLYPRKAAEEGITGWVKLKFDIDKFGNTYNLEVVDANPKNVFDNNAKTAIKDWKFENNKNQKEIFYTMEFVLE
jgi:TonB family protein